MYWMVEFHYMGPKGNPEDHAAGELAWDLDFKIKKALSAAKLSYNHAYSYPDGSMFNYIKSNFYLEQLRGTIVNILKKNCLWVEVEKYDYNDDKFKCVCNIVINELPKDYKITQGKTIEELFEGR